MEEEIIVIQEPTYQYVPSLDGNYWVKIEMLRGRTLVDNYRDREMIWHRTLYATSISGEYEPLHTVPFGYQAVSGDDYRG